MRVCRVVAWGVFVPALLLASCGTDRQAAEATTSSPSTAPPPPPALSRSTEDPNPPEPTNWVELQAGQCLADPPPTDPLIVVVDVVDCSTPHSAEVYLRKSVPVNAAVTGVAEGECNRGLQSYSGKPLAGSPFSVTYLIDSEQDRTSSNPFPSSVICVLQNANGQPLTASARR